VKRLSSSSRKKLSFKVFLISWGPLIQKRICVSYFFFYAPQTRRDHKSTGVTTGSISWVLMPQLIILSSCTSIYFRKFDTIVFSLEYIYLFLIFKLKNKFIGSLMQTMECYMEPKSKNAFAFSRSFFMPKNSTYFRKFDTIIFSWKYIYLFLIFKLKKSQLDH
jgi:hypothetical protein